MTLFFLRIKTELARTMSLLPVRYAVIVGFVLTLSYAGIHIIPVIKKDLIVLNDVRHKEIQGLTLEGELQGKIQQSRTQLSRILAEAPFSKEFPQDVAAMRQFDQSIAATSDKIAQLGVEPKIDSTQFRQSWTSYKDVREQVLSAAQKGDHATAQAVDSKEGEEAFQLAEQSAQKDGATFEAISAENVDQVTTELNQVLRELVLSMGLRIAILGLLIWIDLRRMQAERQLKLANRDLRIVEDRFRQAYDSAVVGMGMFSLDGTLLSSNRRAANILGYEPEDMVGRKVSEFIAPECQDGHVEHVATLATGRAANYQAERRVLKKNGDSAWVRNSVTQMRPEEEPAHYFFISEEITSQKLANDRLAYLANYDPVANLPSRRYFEELLTGTLTPMAGFFKPVALFYIEVDSFDFLKGTFGITVADEVLGELGASLAEFQREGEIIGRIEDHVFAMTTPSAAYDQGALNRAAELRDLFHRFSESGKHRIPLSASIGVAFSEDPIERKPRTVAPDADSNVEQAPAGNLLKFARAAMLEARLRGGDCIYVADPALQERAMQRHQIELALLRGLDANEFRVVFQPQFDVASGELIRFEALCRWTSKELGPIAPDRFIPIAEQTGLILEIGRRVLVDALVQAKTWIADGRRIGVAVNISPMQFMRPDFPNIVTQILAETQFPPALLELEITEGIFIRDLNLAVARIRELQRLGLSIALDDFGTGYSSLSYLQRMPINAVKLDRSFISDLTTDAATVSMVRSVLSMAGALHLRVVTEGVETEQQLEILKSLGCDEAQGYLLGRPESSELAFARVLSSPLGTASQEAIEHLTRQA